MKKSLIHANITCDFDDGDISRLGVAYLTHVNVIPTCIHRYLDYIKIKYCIAGASVTLKSSLFT